MTTTSQPNGTSKPNLFEDIARNVEFWSRAVFIYGNYKSAQARSLAWKLTGKDDETIKQGLWDPHHTWAGEQMYELCISLRGFYLKMGQFIGARGDFVPEQICRKLSRLHDKVPPMPPAKVEAIIKQELGVQDLSRIFDWIDLDNPLGSASISQVHKAKMRAWSKQELRSSKAGGQGRVVEHELTEGQAAWDICNLYGISLDELSRSNKGLKLEALRAGQVLKVPQPRTLMDSKTCCSRGVEAEAAALHAVATGRVPSSGLVAVKVQYPEAALTMGRDLVNIRAAAAFLSKTELKFDLVSAVDELSKQIRLEFDFTREARVMDTVAGHLRPLRKWLEVPETITGLVTQRLLVMNFLEGVPLQEAGRRVSELSARRREMARRLILRRVSDAYGHMILGEGLFQADGHPGNILVMKGGRIGLIDYGQSKQLAPAERRRFASLVLAINKNNAEEVVKALDDLGVVTERRDPEVMRRMAVGMFDTRGKVDPFDPNSPIKKCAIKTFPQEMFFVLRVVQLLRGMAAGMGISDFSSASQWRKLATNTVRTIDERVVQPLVV